MDPTGDGAEDSEEGELVAGGERGTDSVVETEMEERVYSDVGEGGTDRGISNMRLRMFIRSA